jgi:hypothetical protein
MATMFGSSGFPPLVEESYFIYKIFMGFVVAMGINVFFFHAIFKDLEASVEHYIISIGPFFC